MDNKTFAKILKEKRTEKGFSFGALAKQVKISPTTLFQYEAGDRYPSSKALGKICTILDLNFGSMLFRVQIEKNMPKKIDLSVFKKLRKLLITRYSEKIEGESTLSKNKFEKMILDDQKYTIEGALLDIIWENLVNKEIASEEKKPINYFTRLAEKGMKKRIVQTGIRWAYSAERDIIKYALDDDLKNIKYRLVLPKESRMYSLSLVREILLNYYSEEYGLLTPNSYVSKKEIQKELETYQPIHPIEHKLLKEIHAKLTEKKLIQANTDPVNFFSIISSTDLSELIKKTGFDWTYCPKDNRILIGFDSGKGERIVRKWKLSWTEIKKE